MEATTSLVINLKQNPAIAELASQLQLGQKISWEIAGSVKDITPDSIVLKVDAVVPEGYEVAEEGEEGEAPQPVGPATSDETIPSAIASMVRKKKE